MAELKNEFSWSKTRDEVFKTCLRQYWFVYYGYWNGWLENAPERTRQIYILKNLKNRQMWAGEKVHECIQRSLYLFSSTCDSPRSFDSQSLYTGCISISA